MPPTVLQQTTMANRSTFQLASPFPLPPMKQDNLEEHINFFISVAKLTTDLNKTIIIMCYCTQENYCERFVHFTWKTDPPFLPARDQPTGPYRFVKAHFLSFSYSVVLTLLSMYVSIC